MNYGAVILAAGKGTRFHRQKQFVQFRGRPVWEHVWHKVQTLIPRENIVVVGVDIQGGQTKTQSVKIGLSELRRKSVPIDRLLILEAARPLVTTEQMQEILLCDQLSCTYVQPLVNTIVGKDGTYLNRENYWTMTTPNAMDFSMLIEAFDSDKYVDLTDETRVMYEHYGIRPHFHMGAENLYKITYPKDIFIIEKLAEELGL